MELNFNYVIGGLLMAFFLFKNPILAKIYGIRSINNNELKQRLNSNSERYLFDVRTVDEFGRGHLKEAINLPLGSIAEHALPGKMSKTSSIYVICASGTRSMIAATQLKKLGFSNVYNVSGGMMAHGPVQ